MTTGLIELALSVVLVSMAETGIVALYRETHHRIAQMFAMGMTPSMIRQQTGISQRRLLLYWNDPTFQDLIAKYSAQQEEKLKLAADALTDAAVGNMLLAEGMITDRLHAALEDGAEPIPLATLNKLFESRADRFGYGKHATIKHEHDFATALDRAIERSGKKDVVKQLELRAEEAAPPTNALPLPGPVEACPLVVPAGPTKPVKTSPPPTFTGVLRRLKIA